MKTLDVAIKVAVLVCALLVGPGCATIVKGTNQRIPVASEPASADVLVDGTFAGKTPTAVLLKRKNDHLITVKKDGY
ncbi:MAG: PEGA domain-containing protein, partial [Rhodococcus sp. (in: high G+C Gram-positive bacteria)]